MEKIDPIKRKRFQKIATARVNKIRLYLKRLSNCSNPNYYQFFEFDIQKIFDEIRHRTTETENLFLVNLGKKQIKRKFEL